MVDSEDSFEEQRSALHMDQPLKIYASVYVSSYSFLFVPALVTARCFDKLSFVGCHSEVFNLFF